VCGGVRDWRVNRCVIKVWLVSPVWGARWRCGQFRTVSSDANRACTLRYAKQWIQRRGVMYFLLRFQEQLIPCNCPSSSFQTSDSPCCLSALAEGVVVPGDEVFVRCGDCLWGNSEEELSKRHNTRVDETDTSMSSASARECGL